jgi:hypothetical protein
VGGPAAGERRFGGSTERPLATAAPVRRDAARDPAYTFFVTRDELIDRTRRLLADGDALLATPSMEALRVWLQRSDELLAGAWGSMDRYHLAWLMVGKPKGIVRGRQMTTEEESAYVREVAAQKSSALRMSLDAVERQGMPFRGETGGAIAGLAPDGAAPAGPGAGDQPQDAPLPRGRFDLPSEADDLAERVRLAREEAARHAAHDVPRAPRPERMQR